MEYWIIRNDSPIGPLSEQGLIEADIAPDTKVWRTGLSDWVEASSLEELEYIIAQAQQKARHNPIPDTPQQPAQHAPQPCEAFESNNSTVTFETTKQPPTFIGWNVAMLVCCCTIGGIVGLIFSLLSSSNYRNGNFAKAQKWSQWAEIMVIVSFTLGCISWPFSILFNFLL